MRNYKNFINDYNLKNMKKYLPETIRKNDMNKKMTLTYDN